MKKIILNVNYIIDGKLTVLQTKMIYEQLIQDEMRGIHFEINFGDYNFISNTISDIELAIINLQKELPSNIKIGCCLSCRYGNFCPFGGNENEIYCLKDITPNNKRDVCNLFSENDIKIRSIASTQRKLLDYCKDYKIISDDGYYTYNDWQYYIKKDG